MISEAIEKMCVAVGFVTAFAVSFSEVIKDVSWHFVLGAFGGLGAWCVARFLNKYFNKKP